MISKTTFLTPWRLFLMAGFGLAAALTAQAQAQGDPQLGPMAPIAAPIAPAAPAPFIFAPRPNELLGDLAPEAYSQRVRQAAVQGMADLYGVCAARTVRPLAFAAYEDTVDPTDSLLPNIRKNGDRAWRERVEVKGCGKSLVQNVLAVRPKGTGPLELMQLLPGETRVSPAVFRNLYSPLMVAVAASGEKCGGPNGAKFVVLSTKITEGPVDGATWDRPWKERWVVKYCAAQIELEPRFAPTPEIGGYALSVAPGLVVTGN
ncbi:MAG: hypothetical protein ACOYJ6_04595 [Caulobacterales bacterium]|jgi:hypothetical protein